MATTYPWDTNATQGDEAQQDQQQANAPASPEGGDRATTQGQGQAQPQTVTTEQLLAEVQKATNQIAYVQRRLDKQDREGVPLSATDRRALSEATARLEAAEEARRTADMDDEERAAYFEKKARDLAEKARQPAQPQSVTVDRDDPDVQEQLGDYFDDFVTAELHELAEDIGLKLGRREIGILRDFGVKQVPIGRDGTADWATWLRKEARPALREEAKRQAAEVAQRQASNINAAVQNRTMPGQGALGGTSRGGGGSSAGGMSWDQAQKIKSVNDMSDDDYFKLVNSRKK